MDPIEALRMLDDAASRLPLPRQGHINLTSATQVVEAALKELASLKAATAAKEKPPET